MFLALLGADPTSDRGFLFGWPDLSQNEPSFARVSHFNVQLVNSSQSCKFEKFSFG
jgi:hypothetical protein